MSERISIVIPTYQHASTLVRCLDSIFAQSRPADEIIVVDDGSTDTTQAVLKPYRDRVQVLVQTNQGAPAARNHGFEKSVGDLVLFCDADVEMRPEMLAELEQALKTHPDASYAYSGFEWGWKTFTSFPFDAARLKQMNYIHTSALIRREKFPKFDTSLKRFQDWDLWLTMLEQGSNGAYIDKSLFLVIQEDRPERMSNWLPSLIIRFPWKYIGWMPKRVQKYREAKKIILEKHHLV
ncbi:MAG: glycosyltransferase family A protein [Candidatus Uhrbacteria bacterium]|nr:glycosyltransferase family A protein [Candidatus Uhrbacteria bacterium]